MKFPSTSKTKDYGEVAGSGKKVLPQKGSGGSRDGDKRGGLSTPPSSSSSSKE
jgi:ribosomal protein L4